MRPIAVLTLVTGMAVGIPAAAQSGDPPTRPALGAGGRDYAAGARPTAPESPVDDTPAPARSTAPAAGQAAPLGRGGLIEQALPGAVDQSLNEPPANRPPPNTVHATPGLHDPATAGDRRAPAGLGAGAGHAPAHDEAHGASEHAEHGEHGGPAPINWVDFGDKHQPPYVVLLANFAILLGIYVYFGRRPIAAALKKRRTDIAKEIEEAQRMKQEAEARAKTYQAKLVTLDEEVAAARAALIQAGKGERDRIVREAEDRAARLSRDAALLLDQESKQLRVDLVRETVDVAIEAAEDVLRGSITPADQERLAEDFLRDLAARAPGIGGLGSPAGTRSGGGLGGPMASGALGVAGRTS